MVLLGCVPSPCRSVSWSVCGVRCGCFSCSSFVRLLCRPVVARVGRRRSCRRGRVCFFWRWALCPRRRAVRRAVVGRLRRVSGLAVARSCGVRAVGARAVGLLVRGCVVAASVSLPRSVLSAALALRASRFAPAGAGWVGFAFFGAGRFARAAALWRVLFAAGFRGAVLPVSVPCGVSCALELRVFLALRSVRRGGFWSRGVLRG